MRFYPLFSPTQFADEPNKENIFYSYGSKKFIKNQKLKNMALAEFRLPNDGTKHLPDERYTI
jgi:hypothetical protein